MPIPAILAMLTAAPQLIGAAGDIYRAVTGKEAPPEALASPQALHAHIEALPAEQRAEIERRLLEHAEEMGRQQTERFKALLSAEAQADVEKLRATARPEIARQAMKVISAFKMLMYFGMAAIALEWLARAGFHVANMFGVGCTEMISPQGAPLRLCGQFPESMSFTHLVAQLEPVTAMIWPSVLAALAAAVSVVRAYFGARERDKARADEMAHGRPLESTAATVANAGGAIANLVRLVRGK